MSRDWRGSTPAGRPRNPRSVDLAGQVLVFVVRADGEPGLFVQDGVTREQAAELLEMMASAVRNDPRWPLEKRMVT